MARFASFAVAAGLAMVVARASRSADELYNMAAMGLACFDGECASVEEEKAFAGQQALMQIQRQAIRKDQASDSTNASAQEAPCQCAATAANWVAPQARAPRCLFVDLGAADGNTYKQFLEGSYGNTKNCPSGGSHQAILVEANPLFEKPLRQLEEGSEGRVKSFTSTAAYMCEGTTSFYLDTVDVKENFWGSSLSPNARDVQRSGQKKVTVPLMNIVKLIAENALPEDFVIIKMDIEGSEWDILPCLAKSPVTKLIDAMYVEKHPSEWSLSGSKDADYEGALQALQARGVATPEYNSPSL